MSDRANKLELSPKRPLFLQQVHFCELVALSLPSGLASMLAALRLSTHPFLAASIVIFLIFSILLDKKWYNGHLKLYFLLLDWTLTMLISHYYLLNNLCVLQTHLLRYYCSAKSIHKNSSYIKNTTLLLYWFHLFTNFYINNFPLIHNIYSSFS